MFLALGCVIASLESLQPHLLWSRRVKTASAWSLAVAAAVYGFLGVWLIWETSVPLSTWWVLAVLAAGAALGILVVLNLSSFVLTVRSVSTQQTHIGTNLATIAYAVSGLFLILDPLVRVWYSALSLSSRVVGQARQPAVAFHLVAYDPIVMTLGALACLLAAETHWPGKQSRAHVAAAVGYTAGVAMFVFALLEWGQNFKLAAFSPVGVVGMAILTVALVIAMLHRPTMATPLAADERLARIVGTGLVLFVLWSSWYGQEWHAAVDATAPSADGPLERLGSSYAFIGVPLGGLVAVLGIRRRNSSSTHFLRLGSSLSRALGCVCLAIGFYSGFGIVGWWKLDIGTELGIVLLLVSLLVDLAERLARRQEAR